VRLKPDDSDAWYNLGAARYYQDNYTGAEEAFQHVVKINQRFASAWYVLGTAYYRQSKFRKSYKALLKAIEIDPQYTEAYAGLVELHGVTQGKLDALERIDRSLQLKKVDDHVRAALHLLRSLALTADENKLAALQALKNGQKWVDKLDPDTQDEERQSVLATLMDSLKSLILPGTWKVADNFLKLLAKTAPGIYEVIGRLEHVIQYYKELELKPGEEVVGRKEATVRAQRILDRLPSEERGPIEEIVKEVDANIRSWRRAEKTAKSPAKKRTST
jgi:tetratricopeptide (TPR) repeat protein